MVDPVVERAKVRRVRGRWIVRLPNRFHFGQQETHVIMRRVGRRIILDPIDEWTPEFLACLGAWRGDIRRPSQQNVTSRKAPLSER